MTDTALCATSDVDPQDWFIRSDGKQYTDDEFLTDDERAGVARSVLPIGGETHEEHEERVKRAINAANGNRKRPALARRRNAKSLCQRCPIREACFEQAIDQNQTHGTWGGFFEEEIAEVQKERARRRRRRVSTSTLL